MNERSNRKQRAVRLTAEARDLLDQRIIDEWAKSGDETRLTRSGRAAMLGVSIATLQRILNRSGNDKAVLIEAFTSVGLEWDESYCEPEKGAASGAPADKEVEPVKIELTLAGAMSVLLVSSAVMLGITLVIAFWGNPLDRSQGKDHQRVQANAITEAGRIDYWAANYDAAIKKADLAAEIAQEAHSLEDGANAFQLKADALAGQGKLDKAADSYLTCLDMWEYSGDKRGEGIALELLAVNEARLNRLEAAEKHFKESRSVLLDLNNGHESPGPLRGLGSVAAVRKDFAAAREWYSQAMNALGQRKNDPMAQDIRALRALILRDEGNYGEAIEELNQCLSFWKKENHTRWIASTKRQIATVYLASGDAEKAKEHLADAITLYESVGDELNTRECEQLRDSGSSSRAEDYF